MRRRLGDRRHRPRYDVVGDLWGTLETVLQLSLKNVGPGGALLESHVLLPSESIHRLTFSWDGQETATQVVVRHVSPSLSSHGEPTYTIGVEFVGMHPALAAEINRQVLMGREDTAVGEA